MATDVGRSSSPEESVLYQDARFTRIGRFQYGLVAYPFVMLGLVGSISTGVAWHVGLALVVSVPPIAICEWRITRMGFRITDETIELIRPLNRTRIRWDEIDQFELIASPGLVDRGSRRVAIKRRRHGIIPRSRMQIPTLWITDRTEGPFSPLNGPTALKTSNGENIPDVMAFLNEQLDTHTNPIVRS